MDTKVNGVYENGVVYLPEPLPANVDPRLRQSVAVEFSSEINDEAAETELKKIENELQSLGSPEDDTSAQRKRRAALVVKALKLLPPFMDEEFAELQESTKRPMSMFAVGL
ncbi:hypothetical protein GC175_23855 [bacterium]|nr:hypothetical protein [bacterium]